MKLRYRIRTWLKNFGLRFRVAGVALAGLFFSGDITPTGRLYATHITPTGGRKYLGLISTRVVTDLGVKFIVDNLRAASSTISNMKYHASGIGVMAETAAQTTLGTEVATRSLGTQVVGATANVYRTAATITYAAPLTITEHGLFDANAAGIMMDRSVFSPIVVIAGDSIDFTYELTLPSGS